VTRSAERYVVLQESQSSVRRVLGEAAVGQGYQRASRGPKRS